MVCANIIPDSFAGMFRGAFKGLGIQPKLIAPHIVYQGILSTILTWYLGFYLDLQVQGIWIAKTVVVLLINISYISILYKTDWFQIT